MNFVKRNFWITHIIFVAVLFFLGFAVGRIGQNDLLGQAKENFLINENKGGIFSENKENEEGKEDEERQKLKTGANTKLVFIRKYTRSGKNSVSEEKLNSSLIGLDVDELSLKYPGWEIVSFTPEKVVLSFSYDSYGEGTYRIGTATNEEGIEILGVYAYDREGNYNIYQTFDSPVSILDKQSIERLREGIIVENEEELNRLLEQYDE